jgi:uncharacterized protein
MPVEWQARRDYCLVMDQTSGRPQEQPASASPRGTTGWTRLVLGALGVFLVWFFFVRSTSVELTWAEQEQLLALAREQLIESVTGEGFIDIYLPDLSDRVLRQGAAFVSLTVDGALRGCMIDQLEAHEPLVTNVLRSVQLAVRSDERFAALSEDEVDRARIKISIVYGMQTLRFRDPDDLVRKLSPYLHGVVLSVDDELATYLPSVWETYPEPAEFLSKLSVKAGWDANRWRVEPYPMVRTYSVVEFSEPE